MDYISLFVKSIFVDNMIFAYFLGMCSYLAVSKNVKTAAGLGVAVIFVLLVTLPINYLLNKFVLAEDGIFITARGAGVAVDFGLKLVEKVHSKEESLRQRNAILCD